MNNDKILSMLGLAARARKVVSGEFMTEQAIKSGQAMLVIVAKDASDNTKKKFRNSCEFYQVPFYEYELSDNLGHHIGKGFRMSMAVTDIGFAQSLEEKLKVFKNTEVNG